MHPSQCRPFGATDKKDGNCEIKHFVPPRREFFNEKLTIREYQTTAYSPARITSFSLYRRSSLLSPSLSLSLSILLSNLVSVAPDGTYGARVRYPRHSFAVILQPLSLSLSLANLFCHLYTEVPLGRVRKFSAQATEARAAEKMRRHEKHRRKGDGE